jgi:chromosome segregation ATPase
MASSNDLETRVAALEARMDSVATDAAAARHLAAAHDHDVSNLTVKVDANRSAINALGEQTRAQFEQVDRRFEQVDRRFEEVDRRFEHLEHKVDSGFAEVRAQLDQTAGGMQQIVGLLNTLIDREHGDPD